MEITEASGPPPLAALGWKMRCTVKKIQLSQAGLAAVQQALKSSTRKTASKVRGASVPPATAEVRSASSGPQVEKEAAQVLGQLCGKVVSPCASSGAQPAAPLRLKFPLRRGGG